MMLRTPHQSWYRTGGSGLELQPRASGIAERGNPSFLARRQQHANATASTVVRFAPEHDGARAGLVAFQNDAYWYFIGVERRTAKRWSCSSGEPVLAIRPDGATIASTALNVAAGAPVYLKISARGGAYDFSYSYAPNRWQPLKLGEDGTILSTKRAGGFVGAVFGLYAYDPHAKEPG